MPSVAESPLRSPARGCRSKWFGLAAIQQLDRLPVYGKAFRPESGQSNNRCGSPCADRRRGDLAHAACCQLLLLTNPGERPWPDASTTTSRLDSPFTCSPRTTTNSFPAASLHYQRRVQGVHPQQQSRSPSSELSALKLPRAPICRRGVTRPPNPSSPSPPRARLLTETSATSSAWMPPRPLTNAIHAGDRNLEVAGQPVAPGPVHPHH